jgi:hypothetical protein
VATWPNWNGDFARIEISRPFVDGSTTSMTPTGEDTVELRITEVSEPDLFVDEAGLRNAVVRTVDRIDPLGDGRLCVSYRMEIAGAAAEGVAQSARA